MKRNAVFLSFLVVAFLLCIVSDREYFIFWQPPETALLGKRVITLKIIADKEFVYFNPDWQAKVEAAVNGASQNFEKNFGISFTICEYEEMDLINGIPSSEKFFNYIYNLLPGGADVLVVFSGKFKLTPDKYLGWAEDRHILMLCESSLIFAREMGHVFGADHSRFCSVMSERICGENEKRLPTEWEWEKKGGEIIFKNKYRNF